MLTKEQRDWVKETYKVKHNPTSLGMFLRYHRLMAPMTIAKVSLFSGLSTSYITNVEIGKRITPSIKTMFKLCKAYKVDGNTLMKLLEEEYETS
jgi:transcriptional regulator with XRE-family HTH domain